MTVAASILATNEYQSNIQSVSFVTVGATANSLK
jgi:hypothetical protein